MRILTRFQGQQTASLVVEIPHNGLFWNFCAIKYYSRGPSKRYLLCPREYGSYLSILAKYNPFWYYGKFSLNHQDDSSKFECNTFPIKQSFISRKMHANILIFILPWFSSPERKFHP